MLNVNEIKMKYEDRVIEAAREGFQLAFIKMDVETEKLLRLVYRAGYKQAVIDRMERENTYERN